MIYKSESAAAKAAAATLVFNAQYSEDAQLALLAGYLAHPTIYAEVEHILNTDYFDDQYHRAANFIRSHYDQYGATPSSEVVKLATGRDIPNLASSGVLPDWLRSETEKFCRYKAYELTVLDGVELIQTNRIEELHRRMDDAASVSLQDAEAPFASLWGDETETVQPPTYLIKPWLVEDTVTCVFGEPGSFKSFFCLEAALCFASGTPFAGHPVKRTSVAYVAAEGQGGIALRVEAWQEKRGVKLRHTDLLLITQPVNLMDAANVSMFIRHLKELEKRHGIHFGVVMLDTYSQCIAGGDENSAAVASLATASMIRMRRELGATVVFVHHTGKDKGRGMRGSDALRGNTDGAIEVERIEGSMSAVAKVVRHKDAPIGGSVPFTMELAGLARLAGCDLDASLVCSFPDQVEVQPTGMSRMQDQKICRDILNRMQDGEVNTLGKIAKLIGMYDSPFYKSKIADVLALNVSIEVTDNSGASLGILRRFLDPAKGDQRYGSVMCEAKTPTNIQQNRLLDRIVSH